MISCQASKVLIHPSFFFLPSQRSHIFQMKASDSFLCNVYSIQTYNMHESGTPYFSTNVTQATELFQEKFHLDDQGLVKKESLTKYLWPGNTYDLLCLFFFFWVILNWRIYILFFLNSKSNTFTNLFNFLLYQYLISA